MIKNNYFNCERIRETLIGIHQSETLSYIVLPLILMTIYVIIDANKSHYILCKINF